MHACVEKQRNGLKKNNNSHINSSEATKISCGDIECHGSLMPNLDITLLFHLCSKGGTCIHIFKSIKLSRKLTGKDACLFTPSGQKQVQTPPAKFKYGKSKFPDNSKSYGRHTPFPHVLIRLLNLKFTLFGRILLGLPFSSEAGGTCICSCKNKKHVSSIQTGSDPKKSK